jgi:hypothetical protein
VILDQEKRIIGVLAGRPTGDDGTTTEWDKAVVDGTAAIDEARGELKFAPGDLAHRRGEFAAKAFGILDGMGHKVSLLLATQRLR